MHCCYSLCNIHVMLYIIFQSIAARRQHNYTSCVVMRNVTDRFLRIRNANPFSALRVAFQRPRYQKSANVGWLKYVLSGFAYYTAGPHLHLSMFSSFDHNFIKDLAGVCWNSAAVRRPKFALPLLRSIFGSKNAARQGQSIYPDILRHTVYPHYPKIRCFTTSPLFLL